MKPSDKYLPKPTRLGEGIWLIDPKYAHNVSTVLRVAACYGMPQLCCTGDRIRDEVDTIARIPREERLREYSMVDLHHHENPFEVLDDDVVPVALEFRPNSTDLCDFEHPKKAVYIFGPEDSSLGRNILTRCHHFVRIDTMECLNLAVAVGTVMYDRQLKEYLKAKTKELVH